MDSRHDDTDFGVPIPGTILPEDRWARTAIKRLPETGLLDFAAMFGRVAPLIVELGCGNARFTIADALLRPECDHFASDLLPVFVRYATRRANQRGLWNVRFAVRDAQTIVRDHLAPGSISEIHLYHPQPYHDPRQARLRLVAPRFLADVHRALTPGGLFVLQTDNPDYWSYFLRIGAEFFAISERSDPWPDMPEGRSRREILARSRGLRIHRCEAKPRTDLDAERMSDLVRTLPLPMFRSRGPWCELDAAEEGGGPPRRGGLTSRDRPRRRGSGPPADRG